MKQPARMRLVSVIALLAAGLFAGSGLAAGIGLVSQTTAGNPGSGDSGSIRGGTEMRPATALDDGTVFFLSVAQLATADSNSVADGTAIVFSSTGSNVVPGDVNNVADVFRYDPTPGVFTLISQRLNNLANADAVTPDISADGQVVCFASADDSFVHGDTNAKSDIFLFHDGAIRRGSIAADGTQADADSASPRLNASGRFVVFVSRAGNLVPGVGNGHSQVFLHDREGGRMEALSVNDAGLPADADCFVPDISPGGRYVTFVSKAANLVNGVSGDWYQVYRADRGRHFANHPPVASGVSLAATPGITINFTLNATDADLDVCQFVLTAWPAHGTLADADGVAIVTGQAYTAASFPWCFVPADGSLFTDSFTFHATDGKTAGSAVTAQIRMVDPDLGFITRISVASDGTQSTRDAYLPYPGLGISADGGFVAFCSTASEPDPADADNGFADIFLRDTVAGSTRLITAHVAVDKHAYRSALAGDGRSAAYYSEDGATLILQDLAGGTRTTINTVSSYLSSAGPGMSHDGTRVAYEKNGKVWLFAAETGTRTEVSVNSQGVAADASCGDVAISADGRVVAFSSAATNLDIANPGGVKSAYLRFPDLGQTILVSETADGERLADAAKPALSETGRDVIFLADDGIVGDGIGKIYVKNIVSGALRLIADSGANPAISADGRFVSYMQSGANGRNQLYRADLAAVPGAVQLVSNAGTGAEGDNDSFRAALSASGRFVAFASNAANLVPGDSNGACDVFLNEFGIPPNDLPVPTLAAVAVDEDTPLLDIPLTYTDAEDNDIRTEIVSGPAHAAQFGIQPRQPGQTTATFTYVPLPDFHGTDSFTYRCGDAAGWSAPATVMITVNPVNDPPRWLGMPVLWGMHPDREFRLDLSRFVEDPDTLGPDPETLYFSLAAGAPAAFLDGSVLVITAAAVAGLEPLILRIGVADRQDGPVVEFGEELAIHVRAPVEIALVAGWNLISFPMTPEPLEPALLLTGPGDAGGRSVPPGPVWYWDAGIRRHRAATTLVPGRAYWVYCHEPATVSMQVAWLVPVDPAVELEPGWNLVGPVGFGEAAFPTVGATDIPIPPGNIWVWDNARYAYPKESRVGSGDGVWIYSPTARTVDFGLRPAP